MNRNHLINRLVDRKMTLGRPTKAFCICMCAPARTICFAGKTPVAGTRQPASGGGKK